MTAHFIRRECSLAIHQCRCLHSQVQVLRPVALDGSLAIREIILRRVACATAAGTWAELSGLACSEGRGTPVCLLFSPKTFVIEVAYLGPGFDLRVGPFPLAPPGWILLPYSSAALPKGLDANRCG